MSEKKEKKEKKEKEKKTVDPMAFFIIPPPKWRDKKFVTSRQFLATYKKFQRSDKGYICIDDVQEFLEVLFMDAEQEGVDFNMAKGFQRDYSFYMEHKREYWISLKQLLETLPMVDITFLSKYRGRRMYTATDFAEIWSNYDSGLKGFLNKEDTETLAFDLLTDLDQKSNPKIHKLLADRMLEIGGSDNDQITFPMFEKIIPVEKNFMNHYKDLSSLKEDDINRICAHYDPNDNGALGGFELQALVRDLEAKKGKGDDILHVVQKTKDVLKSFGLSDDKQISKDKFKSITAALGH